MKKELAPHWKKCKQYQTISNGKKGCKACKKQLVLANFKVNKFLHSGFDSTCKECITGAYIQRHRILKQEFVDAYGGKCKCCGIRQIEFLTLEHIFNDGAKERKQLQKSICTKRKIVGSIMYKILKKRGWPKDRYTVLCWNCNCAKKWGKPCPHEKVKHQRYLKNIQHRSQLVIRCKI